MNYGEDRIEINKLTTHCIVLGTLIGLVLGLAGMCMILGYGPLGYMSCYAAVFGMGLVVGWKRRSIRILLEIEDV